MTFRNVARDLGAHVTAATFDRAGAQAAFALGDGTIRLVSAHAPEDFITANAHAGAALVLAQDVGATGFLSGGDDGRLVRIAPDGSATELAGFGTKWVEQVATFADGKSSVIACSAGKLAHLLTAAGERLKTLSHPSTVTGLAFDAKGKRLGVSHYNGASLWFVTARTDTPRVLEWKGSHTAIALHPAGEAVATAMQENALHGWRLPDGHDMRMSGYPSKTESLAFTKNGRWLASSGADAIVLWPFFGGGPMGKPPLELGQVEGTLCTRIACHPQAEIVAAGFADGRLILADIASRAAHRLDAGGTAPVSALAWDAAGKTLAWGGADGAAGLHGF